MVTNWQPYKQVSRTISRFLTIDQPEWILWAVAIKIDKNTKKTAGSIDQLGATEIRICRCLLTQSPMIQWLIYEKFGVEYSVFYIPQLLKNMGFSYQKAKFVADHKEPEKGKLWKKIKEKEIHLHYFPTFDSLKSKVEEALLHFKDLKNEVLALFGFCNKLAEAWSKFNPNYFLCITR